VSHESVDQVIAAAQRLGVRIAWVLETHAHADHLSGAQRVRETTGAPVAIGAHIREVQALFAPRFMADDVTPDGRAFDRLVEEGEALPLGEGAVRVLHTPGHTPACVTYLIGDAAFVGDTLFMPDYGTARADFPGGDAATLYRSIRKILALPGETRIFVGHDYKAHGRDAYAWETSVAEERARNVQVHDGVSEEAFVAARKKRDAGLAAPRLLLPSLQVNIRGGRLPPADADGVRRLRIPLTIVA
jgi:glyoxylase-like metal-dependent hydrolase (beta-lactamase superfamily II)